MRNTLCLCLCLFLVSGLVMVASAATSAVCPMYRCGRTVDIRYPFWVGGDMGTTGNDAGGAANASHCGYPSLRLECRRDTPMLRLPSGDYAVTSILYGDTVHVNRTVSLFDVGVFKNNGTCPVVAGCNLTLPPGTPPPLSITPRNSNLTFLLNCTFAEFAADHLIPCVQNGSYVFRDGHVPYDDAGLCQQVVSMPVLNPLDDVVLALKAGFELSWRLAVGGQCGGCEKAGGLCGQHREVAHDGWSFTCFSRSNTTSASKSSSASGGKMISTGMAITIAIMGSILLICCISLCLVFWGKRHQPDADN